MPPHDEQRIDAANDSAATRRRAPWILYLLIDPTTERTNHDEGTIFYVGARPSIQSQGRRKPDVLDPLDLAAPESLPQDEAATRARVEHIISKGAEPIVEVIADHRAWDEGFQAGENDLSRMIGLLCNTLRPPPLNAPTRAIRDIVRYPSDLVARGLEARRTGLPDRVVVYRTIQSCAPFPSVADLLAAPPSVVAESLGQLAWARTPTVIQREAAEEGLVWLLVAGARLAERILPAGFVLGVWEVDRLDHEDGRIRLHTVESERSEALRRHLLGTVIDIWDGQDGLHRVKQV